MPTPGRRSTLLCGVAAVAIAGLGVVRATAGGLRVQSRAGDLWLQLRPVRLRQGQFGRSAILALRYVVHKRRLLSMRASFRPECAGSEGDK